MSVRGQKHKSSDRRNIKNRKHKMSKKHFLFAQLKQKEMLSFLFFYEAYELLERVTTRGCVSGAWNN